MANVNVNFWKEEKVANAPRRRNEEGAYVGSKIFLVEKTEGWATSSMTLTFSTK